MGKRKQMGKGKQKAKIKNLRDYMMQLSDEQFAKMIRPKARQDVDPEEEAEEKVDFLDAITKAHWSNYLIVDGYNAKGQRVEGPEEEEEELPTIQEIDSCFGDQPMSKSGCKVNSSGDSPVNVVTSAASSYQEKKDKPLKS